MAAILRAGDRKPLPGGFLQGYASLGVHSQIFFLTRRLRIHRQLIDHPTSAIQDRSVYEDAEVFAQNLFRQGLLDRRDYGRLPGTVPGAV